MSDVAGFFGKLPSHGDFVSRRVSRDFLSVWDVWLQRCIAESKASLGDRWLDIFLTSPIWRFVITPGVCDSNAHVGAIMPSVDRVGRYFPLTVVSPLASDVPPVAMLATADEWFRRVEGLMLSVLLENAPTLDEFDQAVASMSLTPVRSATSAALLSAPVSEAIGPHSIWWTAGVDVDANSFIATQRLPDPAQYMAMLLNDERAAGVVEAASPVWPSVAPVSEQPFIDTIATDGPLRDDLMPGLDDTAPPAGDTAKVSVMPPADADLSHLSLEDLINMPAELFCSSAAATDTGKVRRENEDAMLDKAADGLWLVADGMGGHAAGKTASAAVVAAVDQVDLPEDIDSRVGSITRALQAANRELRNYSVHRPESSGLGATVAVLTIVDNSAAIVWAGDTRVYRKRGHQLEQLTTDHSERQEMIERGDIASILGPSNVVTRAVGGEDALRVSTIRQSLQPGDRFLMCSDGVYDEVPVHELVELLEAPDSAMVCRNILQRVNEGRAADNATAIVVDVKAGK